MRVAGKVTLENPPLEALREYHDPKRAITVRLNHAGNQFFSTGSNGDAELALDQSEIDLGNLPPEKFRLVVRAAGRGVGRAVGPRSTVSDANGRFSLDGVPPGRVVIRLDVPAGYVESQGVSAFVTPGQETALGDIRLVSGPDPDTERGLFGFRIAWPPRGKSAGALSISSPMPRTSLTMECSLSALNWSIM